MDFVESSRACVMNEDAISVVLDVFVIEGLDETLPLVFFDILLRQPRP
jgi:hypothetical protein